ncbi:hypothetical protein B296_00023420 [Ensete ventricosum]|uniref:Uncharacterized protein n=1 Tax=Ensete ventricosum TaxID=4639 RepID=A0A427AIV5_ENSVE|nr:hypothetical protein B296_00023420 [Ensete ventricosum]
MRCQCCTRLMMPTSDWSSCSPCRLSRFNRLIVTSRPCSSFPFHNNPRTPSSRKKLASENQSVTPASSSYEANRRQRTLRFSTPMRDQKGTKRRGQRVLDMSFWISPLPVDYSEDIYTCGAEEGCTEMFNERGAFN